MLDLRQRHAYMYAFREAHIELGRAPGPGEWEHHLTPCMRAELVELGVAQPVDELESLEAALVPCGC